MAQVGILEIAVLVCEVAGLFCEIASLITLTNEDLTLPGSLVSLPGSLVSLTGSLVSQFSSFDGLHVIIISFHPTSSQLIILSHLITISSQHSEPAKLVSEPAVLI